MISRAEFQLFANFVQAISIVMCLIVIFSARVLSSRKIHQDYQFIVTFNASVDLVFACFLCVFSFTPILVDHLFIITVERSFFQGLSSESTAVIVQLMTSLVEATILCIAVHFWYRHDVVCKSNHWSHKQYIVTYMCLFSLIVIYFGCSLVSVERMENYVEVLASLEDYRNDTPVFCVYDVNYIPSVLMLGFYQLIHMTFYGITVYFGVKVVCEVRRIDPAVRSTLRAQRYMVRVLLLQALYPLLLLTLPATIMIILAYFRFTIIPLFYCLSIMLQSLPMLNSLSVLTLVPAYRRLIIGQKLSPSRVIVTYFESTLPSQMEKAS